MLNFCKSIVYVTALFFAISAQAQDWSALVIGNPGSAAPNAFADSFNVSKSFKTGNVSSVTLHRQISDAAVADAIFDTAGQSQILFYYSGPLSVENEQTFLSEVPVPSLSIEAILSTFADKGTSEVFILIEDCGGAAGQAGLVRSPKNIPQNLKLHFAASSGTGPDCDAFSARLSDLLISAKHVYPTTHLQDILASAWTGILMEKPVIVSAEIEASPISPITAGFSPIIDTDSPIVSIVETPVISPLIPVGLSKTARITAAQAKDVVGDSNVIIFVVPQKEIQASLAVPAGMPEPSIIIGVLQSESASYDVIDDDPSAGAGSNGISSTEVTFDNLDARRAMRAQGEELFVELVNQGAFDPSAQVLVVALQTELKRMDCYRSVIDGDWGRGSRSSVKRYFDEFGGKAVTLKPTIDLFRQIILKDDIKCAAAVATTRPATTKTKRKKSSGATTARARTKAKPTPAPAPAKKKARGTIGAISGIGLGMN